MFIDDGLNKGSEVMVVKVLGGSDELSKLIPQGVKFSALAIGMIHDNSHREKFTAN